MWSTGLTLHCRQGLEDQAQGTQKTRQACDRSNKSPTAAFYMDTAALVLYMYGCTCNRGIKSPESPPTAAL